MKHLLTIAGSDSSGGAGVQADLKTFAAHGAYGMSVITAVTAQNTLGVTAVQDILPDIIAAQIDAVFSDIRVDAVKIGMLSRVETICCVAERLRYWQPAIVVLDPVMVSKSGYALLQPEACQALVRELLPLATLATPNLPEAETLLQRSIADRDAMIQAAHDLLTMGMKAVLLKGGHLSGSADDFLLTDQGEAWFKGERIVSSHTHGTGCTLSSALAVNLANGLSMFDAVKDSKAYVAEGIRHGLAIGGGCGPTHHFYGLYKKAGLRYE